MATLEQLPHPFSAKSVRHNVAGVIMSLDLALFGLLDAAFDGFAIGCIEGHSAVLPLTLPLPFTESTLLGSAVAQDLVTRVQPWALRASASHSSSWEMGMNGGAWMSTLRPEMERVALC